MDHFFARLRRAEAMALTSSRPHLRTVKSLRIQHGDEFGNDHDAIG